MRILDGLALYSPVLVGILLMLPRLASPHFGLLDDGQTFENALQVINGNWSVIFENAYERTRPIYWLFYTLIYSLVGRSPFWFYMVNLAVFLVIIASVIGLVRSLGGSRGQAWFSGLIFALSGPVIENTYTLSKAELMQMALLLASLLLFARLVVKAKPWRSWGLIAGVVVSTLLAAMFKEVTLLVVAITCGWIAVSVLLDLFARGRKPAAATDERKPGKTTATGMAGSGSFTVPLLVFLGAQAAAALVFLLIRLIVTGSVAIQKTNTSYAANFDLSVGKLITSLVKWGGWVVHDFPYLPVILVFLIAWVIWGGNHPLRRRFPQPVLLVGAGLWMAAWFLFYLPWRFTVAYYLLPFAIGSSMVCGVVLGEAIKTRRGESNAAKAARWVGVSTALILFLGSLVNNATNARVQLTVDDANAAMLNYVAANAPQNSRVLLNLSPQSEYSVEIGQHLRLIDQRPDLKVMVLNAKSLAEATASADPYLLVSPELTNQLILSVRMGVSEPDVRQANESLKAQIGDRSLQILNLIRQFNLFSIDFPRLGCVLIPKWSYCDKQDRTLIDRRLFTYGWKIYLGNMP
jgi:hypothetical protein